MPTFAHIIQNSTVAERTTVNLLRVRLQSSSNSGGTTNFTWDPRLGGLLQIDVTGSGGTFNLTLDGAYTPLAGDLVYVIIDQTGVTNNLTMNWPSEFIFSNSADEVASASKDFDRTMWVGLYTTLATDGFLMTKHIYP